jgi:hypothetical protein
VARLAPLLVAVALLAATAFAFAFAEHLKLEPSPIRGPRVDRVFSPVCECAQDLAHVGFSLREGGRISVAIVDDDGAVVRTLVSDQHYDRGPVQLVWDGRDEGRRLVSDGVYRPRVDLERRTPILMPNRIEVDTKAPEVRITGTSRRTISPDGDGRFDGITLSYRLGEPARAFFYVGRVRHEVKRSRKTTGTFRWFGRIDGTAARKGLYRLSIAAADDAGNVSERTLSVPVRIRFLELDPIPRAAAGRLFRVHVDTDLRTVAWSLGRRHGRASPRRLTLRAPNRPGVYRLTLSGHGHRDTTRLVVRRR